MRVASSSPSRRRLSVPERAQLVGCLRSHPFSNGFPPSGPRPDPSRVRVFFSALPVARHLGVPSRGPLRGRRVAPPAALSLRPGGALALVRTETRQVLGPRDACRGTVEASGQPFSRQLSRAQPFSISVCQRRP